MFMRALVNVIRYSSAIPCLLLKVVKNIISWLYQPFSSYPLKCQQQSQPPLRPPFLSQVEVLSYKPWPPSLSDHQFQSQVHYQLWHQYPHAHPNPPFLVVFAAVAALRYFLYSVLLTFGAIYYIDVYCIISRYCY